MPEAITLKLVLAVIIGAAGGYAWYRVVGCSTGSCPITSNPWSSTAYGALVGGLIGHGM